MPVGRLIQRIPANERGAGLLIGVEAQEKIRKAQDGAGALVAAPPNGLGQRVVGPVREGITIDHEQRPPAGHPHRLSSHSTRLIRTEAAMFAPAASSHTPYVP